VTKENRGNGMADWDPEIDAPAVVAILGAGPIGIEAALYARFLGYDVLLFDQGKVAGNVLR
jgi:NADPH-dependent 2,4-dienoyl-CoA reductase/sulfur reductase-like enzyme